MIINNVEFRCDIRNGSEKEEEEEKNVMDR